MTPLSSIYKVKEALHSNQISGTYYSDPNAINQSIGMINLLGLFMKLPFGASAFFLLIDILQIYYQLKIVRYVWSFKKNVSNYES